MLQMDELCAVSTHERDHPRAGCCVRVRARTCTDVHGRGLMVTVGYGADLDNTVVKGARE